MARKNPRTLLLEMMANRTDKLARKEVLKRFEREFGDAAPRLADRWYCKLGLARLEARKRRARIVAEKEARKPKTIVSTSRPPRTLISTLTAATSGIEPVLQSVYTRKIIVPADFQYAKVDPRNLVRPPNRAARRAAAQALSTITYDIKE